MHMQRNWVGSVLFSLIFSLLLAGCSSGGGDGDAPPPATITGTAEGFWTGTTDNGRTVWGAVLDDDTYWFLYSAVGNPSLLAGAFQGNGRSQNGVFTSSNGVDFNLEGFGPLDATLAANYVMRQSFNGVVTYPTATQTAFTSTFNTDIDYDTAPSVAPLVGTYIASTTATITIDPSGSITGTHDICGYTGALSPRASGNVYDVSITSFGRICAGSGLLQTGVAWFDAATNRIYIMTINRVNGVNTVFSFLFLGTKQ